MKLRRHALWVSTGLAGLLLSASPSQAVEYRLLVASIFDTALTSFVTAKDLYYGATGPGLVRLETDLDTGEIDVGAMPSGRSLSSGGSRTGRSVRRTLDSTRCHVKPGGRRSA